MVHPAFSSPDRLRDIAYLQAPMRHESKENALDTLREYDTVIIMDDSASMLQDRRWERVRTITVTALATCSSVIWKGLQCVERARSNGRYV